MFAILYTDSQSEDRVIGPFPTHELARNAAISMIKDGCSDTDIDTKPLIQDLEDDDTVEINDVGSESFSVSIYPIEAPFGRQTVSLTYKEAKLVEAAIRDGVDDTILTDAEASEFNALVSKFSTQA